MRDEESTREPMPSWTKRSAEILGVFANHNFYVNGFSPRELRTTLENLGPTYVKIGQIMSSRTDMLPKDYCQELERLRSSVAPLDADVARAVIEQETGKRIEDIYLEFRDELLGSASMAKAHFGVLLDGTPAVTKVQRPLIADMMRRDFVLLRKMRSTCAQLWPSSRRSPRRSSTSGWRPRTPASSASSASRMTRWSRARAS